MKKVKVITRLFAAICFVCAIAISCINVFSAEIVIDTNKSASLMLAYRNATDPLEGVNVKIYRVANVNSRKVFTLTGDFKNYPVNINNLDTATKMNTAAQTLSAYAAADKIEPYAELKTNENGIVKLENLRAGLFLVVSENTTIDDVTYKFAPFLVELPEVDDDGNLNYTDVIASPKKEEFDPNKPGDKTKLTVTKRWYDYGNEDKRPESIAVQILKNGEVYKDIVLSRENNWTFSWVDYGGANIWQAVEKNVPDGYTFSLSVGKNTLVLNNTYEKEETTTDKDETTTRPGGVVTTVPSTKPGETTTKPMGGETTLPTGETTLPSGDETTSSTGSEVTTSPSEDGTTASSGEGTTSPSGDDVTTDTPERLPQTGQLWWPVPVLAAAGLMLFALGWVITSKEKA